MTPKRSANLAGMIASAMRAHMVAMSSVTVITMPAAAGTTVDMFHTFALFHEFFSHLKTSFWFQVWFIVCEVLRISY